MDILMKKRQMDVMNTSINQECCEIINKLLICMNCISPPIESLFELSDGSTIAELIDNYESAFGRSLEWIDNYSFIKKWLNIHEVLMPSGRDIKELLKSDRLYCLVIISYSVLSIFSRNSKHLKKKFPNYSLIINNEILLSMITYVKWQLCEEEMTVKQKQIENMKLKIKKLETDNSKARIKVIELKNSLNNNQKVNVNSGKKGISKLLAELAVQKVNERKKRIEIVTYTEC
jgi:hypothetical protein